MNPCAFSIGFRSLRWMFSTSDASNTWLVVEVDDRDRHLAQARGLGGPQPALAGDQLELVADRADHERLQHRRGP